MPQLPGNLQASPIWQRDGIPRGPEPGLQTYPGSPPKQSGWDAESTDELAMLQINLPRTACGDMTMATSQWSSTPITSPHSLTECPSDTVTRFSMGEEVEKLLSGALSNTPEVSCTHFPQETTTHGTQYSNSQPGESLF